MNLTDELLVEIGFINKGRINDLYEWYCLYVADVGYFFISIENDGKHRLYFHKENQRVNWNIISIISDLKHLIIEITRVTKLECIKIGKNIKQNEIKSVLGI